MKLEVTKLGKANQTQKDKSEGRVMSQVNVIKVASHHGRKHHGDSHCQVQLINANEAYGGMERQSQCWIQGLLIDLTYLYALTQD